jgi:transketolase
MQTHNYLKEKAFLIRKSIIESLTAAGSGHLGGSLGLADIFSVMYFSVMKHRPGEPNWEDRDRLILSIGHVAPVLYASLAEAGYFPKEELLTLRKLGSRLQGHPGREHGLPGLELSAGSLGQGLSVATGLALAARLRGQPWTVFAILGDGELQEGSVWEAAMSAAHHQLDHLIAIVDLNGVQIDGPTQEVMNIEPLTDKWEAFGWKVWECDGHDIEMLLSTFSRAAQHPSQPSVILAHTSMGKGIPSIEGDYRWHGKAPTEKQALAFLQELKAGFSY